MATTRILKRLTSSLLTFSCCVSAVEAAQCQFNISNQWNSGFTSSITVLNDSEQIIDGWEVLLTYPDGSTITNAWNTDLSGNNPFQLNNKTYNKRIEPGKNVSFGFNSQKANHGTPAVAPLLGGICQPEPHSETPRLTAQINTDVTHGNAPLTVVFNGSESVALHSDIVSYHWSFDDGNSAEGAVNSHTFESAGNYLVSLTVTDTTGQSSTENVAITAEAASPQDALCEFSVANEWLSGFTGNVRITNESTVEWKEWQITLVFDDNTQISGSWNSKLSGNNPYEISNANYNGKIAPGTSVEFGFNAQKATSGDDVTPPSFGGLCRNTDTGPINSAPTASAIVSPITGQAPLTVNFDGTASSDPDGDALSWLWLLSNGEQLSGERSQHTFNEPGNYEVSLRVDDGKLTSESETVTILVTESETPPNNVFALNTTKSSLWFVSNKKTHVQENHTFTKLSGDITSDGQARLVIDLNSIESAIDIRNERMREHLFEVDLFPEAEVLLDIDMTEVNRLQPGHLQVMNITALLNLHGVSAPVDASIRLAKLPSGELLVSTIKPILINANDFNLIAGIGTLKELAGLTNIGYVVPVNFTLLYNPQ